MMAAGELRVYRALYLNREGLHIRDISKKADLTLPAVSAHVRKGEERGVISCTTKGRMKTCRLNLGRKELVPVLQEVEWSRFVQLPGAIRRSINSFLDDLQEKPLIALLFGSFATGKQGSASDVDVLLVYQRVDDVLMKNVEASAAKINGRTRANIQPVSISYDEFRKEMLNARNEFMKDIRRSGLVVCGMEAYLGLIAGVYA
ncbi:MAG: nucleotidyltransferase domain-containing protein [Candidatus Aenigmarchaeota archaeon]|nr:nucleotidyltransferase domain-containing protein [Candidatus Aenigmarchaeota archaeon]